MKRRFIYFPPGCFHSTGFYAVAPWEGRDLVLLIGPFSTLQAAWEATQPW